MIFVCTIGIRIKQIKCIVDNTFRIISFINTTTLIQTQSDDFAKNIIICVKYIFNRIITVTIYQSQ
jgi:hypothetical protein